MDNCNPSPVGRGMTGHTLRGLFWLFSSTGVQSILRLAVTVILARLLTPTDFGMVAAATVVIGVAEIFSQLGIGLSVVQFPNLEPRHIYAGFTISLLLGVLCGGITLLIAPIVAQFYQVQALTAILRALAINFPLRGVAVVAESLLQRDLQFRKLAIADVISYSLGYGAVGILMAFAGAGVWALVAATIAQAVLRAVVLLIMQPHPWSIRFELAPIRELLYLGGGFTSAQMFNYFALKGDNLVVGRWLGADALGFYTRAYNLMAMSVSLTGQALNKVLFTTLSRVQHEPERLRTAYRRGVTLMTLLVLPASVIAYVLAPQLIYVLLGPAWNAAIVPFRILALGMYFRTGYKVSGTLSQAVGAVYGNARRQALYAVLVVGGAWIGQNWGLPGVAMGVLVALVVHFLLLSQLALRLVSLTWREFVMMHLPGIRLAVIIGIGGWGMVSVLNNLHLPPIVVFIAPLGIIVVTLLLSLWLVPRFVLGREALWLLKAILEYGTRRLPMLTPIVEAMEPRYMET